MASVGERAVKDDNEPRHRPRRDARWVPEPHAGLKPAAFEAGVLLFIGLGIVVLGFVFCLPPIPQDQSYHAFADGRTMLGVPDFLNVTTNLPFLIVGALGLRLLCRPVEAMASA
jgi:hypothetical protein